MIDWIVVLTLLYSLWWIITFLWFIPTMIDLYKWKPSANINTYLIWFLTTLITSLYWFFVLKDFMFNIVINLQLLACSIVLLLSVRLKYKK